MTRSATTPPAPDPRSLVSAQLLTDLVNNTLDPGYAAAAARRGPDRPPAGWGTGAVAFGCALIGFLLVVSYVHTHRSAPEAAKAHNRLVDRVRTAQSSADTLAHQVEHLDDQVNTLRDQALPQSGALADRLAADEFAAGQTAVTGPGLTVTLTDPATPKSTPSGARGGTVALQQTNNLTDRDVRSVVDELWHDGAEAIAVNGVRLTPTSAVRFAGDAVLVDFQPVGSPYRIAAIGNQDALPVAFAQSAVASRYKTLEGVQGIGFSFDDTGKLTLPAGGPSVLRYAKAGSR